MPQMLGETSDKCIFYVINWSGFAFLFLITWKWNMLVKREMLREVWGDLEGLFQSVPVLLLQLGTPGRFYKYWVARSCMCTILVSTDNQLICMNSEYSQSGPFTWEQASNFHWHSALFIWASSTWKQMGQNSPHWHNAGNVLLFREKGILDSVVYCCSNSSSWPRAWPTIRSQGSGAFLKAGAEHRCGSSVKRNLNC